MNLRRLLPTPTWRATTARPFCRRARFTRVTKPLSRRACCWCNAGYSHGLRNRPFFTLAEFNAAIRELLIDLNKRPFKKLEGSRASAFASIDRPAMAPLPLTRYEYAQWKSAIVNIDYHVEIDGHYYSVPHSLVRLKIEVSYSATTVECFFKGKRVAVHVRSHSRGRHTTLAEHMPESHRRHSEWSPGRLLNWALGIGAGTRDVVKWQLENRPHPEQGYRACLGLLNLAKHYGPERLEAAAQRALSIGSPTRKRYPSRSWTQSSISTRISLLRLLPRIPLHPRRPRMPTYAEPTSSAAPSPPT